MSSDRELVERVQCGDIECFKTLFDKYGQRLFNVVLHLVGDEAEAHDVTQEAFVKAYQAIGSFKFRSQFYTWLYRIGVNQARDHVRKRRHHPATVSLDDTRAPESATGQTALITPSAGRLRLQATIDQILGSLNPEQRAIMTLREIEGFSYGEIAEILGVSLGTVKSRLARAREDIRQRFGSAFDIAKE